MTLAVFRIRSLASAALAFLFIAQAPTPTRAANRRHLLLHAARATISTEQLHDHAEVLAGDSFEGREAGSRGGQAAARYVQKQLESAGLQTGAGDSYLQRFYGNMCNLLGAIPGADPEVADEVILVGAHYDHVGYGSPRNSYGPWGYIHNGADDNASGVAVLLETIEALQIVQYQPRRTILFAFWDGEEKNLLGSRHWVRQPTVPLNRVKMAFNVDMVGRMVDGKLIVGGSRTGIGMRKLLSNRALPSDLWIDYTWEYKENSDHWPLFERGVPSLYIHTGLHDDYHRPSDDVERLNIEGIHKTADFLMTAVTEAADAERMPEYRSAARLDTLARQRTQEAPLPPSDRPARLGLAWRADPAEPSTVFITRVNKNSPAETAGLRLRDRIYELDGEPVGDETKLLKAVQARLAEDAQRLALVVERKGRIFDIEVELEPAPTEMKDPAL